MSYQSIVAFVAKSLTLIDLIPPCSRSTRSLMLTNAVDKHGPTAMAICAASNDHINKLTFANAKQVLFSDLCTDLVPVIGFLIPNSLSR